MYLFGIDALANPSAEAPAKRATPVGYELTIKPDLENHAAPSLLVKLERDQAQAAETVSEVIVHWTTPGGQPVSFPIRRVSGTVWASQVSLAPENGKNKLDVLILGKNGEESPSEITELLYEFEQPGGQLVFIGRREPWHPGESLLKSPFLTGMKAVSIPVVVLMVGFFNLVLLLSGLLVFKILRRFSAAGDRRGTVLHQGGAALHPLYGKLLAGAGLIDRRTGAPLAWGAGQAEELKTDEENGSAVRKEALETTLMEPAGENAGAADTARPNYSLKDIKNLTTNELVELVGDAIDRLEHGKVTDDVKKLIKAAERELASREQAAETQAEVPPAEQPDPPTGAASRDVKTINGSAELKEKTLKLDLHDLSF